MGASWINTVMGIIVIVGDIAAYVAKYFSDNPQPTTVSEWIMYGVVLVMGGIGIVSKQWNVSNSKDPAAPMVVAPSAAVIVNPAPKV